MKKFLRQITITLLLPLLCSSAFGQSKRFLQIEMNGGVSQPVGSFSNVEMFAGQGRHLGGGFDYFFSKIGFGFSAGTFNNESATLFSNYINQKYYELPSKGSQSYWNSKYILVGPTLKLSYGKFEFDFYAKGGGSQIIVPDLLFNKRFFSQSYEVYHFTGTSKDWQFAWSAGSKVIFKINHWLGIQAKADYFATNYLSKVDYDYTYRNASDGNRNGVIEDTEYFEAQKINSAGSIGLSVLNLNMGLVFQLGRPNQKPVKMVSEIFVQEIAEIQKVDEAVITEEPEVVKEPVVEAAIPNVERAEPEIPIVNAYEEIEAKTAEEERLKLEPVAIPLTTYDAPEAEYDAEAAEFLYKAGESYFAANEYEDALPCFNKLKSDPKYPRAKYMFALSLCAMGNCNEGKREYKEFAKTYKEQDSRTLEIIFASQFEKCAQANKKKDPKISANINTQKGVSTPAGNNDKLTAHEYRIQFIAMKKSNANFPGVSKVGTIETEFFPNKSVYRYTLLGYEAVEKAAEDLAKVRKLGFRDAFIAIYENGKRVNTIYHKR